MHLNRLAAALALATVFLVHVEAAALEDLDKQKTSEGAPFIEVVQHRPSVDSRLLLQSPVFPAEDAHLALPYGFRDGQYHSWSGLEVGSGTPVCSILPGRVTSVGTDSVVVATKTNVEVTYYGLLPTVRQGSDVNAGQPLGTAIGGLLTIRATKEGIPYDIIGTLFPNKVPLADETARVEAERKALVEELARRAKAKRKALAAKSACSAETHTARGRQYTATHVDRLLASAALRRGLDPDLVRAMARVESGLNPLAVSPKGAMGLMQLMPGTATELGVSDPFDPRQNAEGGAEYLRRMLDRFGGNLDLALAAYNAGPAAVEQYGGIPPYAETQAYVRAVKAKYAALKGERKNSDSKTGGSL